MEKRSVVLRTQRGCLVLVLWSISALKASDPLSLGCGVCVCAYGQSGAAPWVLLSWVLLFVGVCFARDDPVT